MRRRWGEAAKRASVLMLACWLPACHTAAALRQLSGPSPVKEVSVQTLPQNPPVLFWWAGYGYGGAADPFLVRMSDRTVYHDGRWTLPSGAVLCLYARGDFESLVPGLVYEVFTPSGAESGLRFPPRELPFAAQAGCTHVLTVDGSFRYAQAVRLVPVEEAEAPIVFALPTERPLGDPRRWAWLAAAPMFDLATLVAIPVVALFLLLVPGEG